MPMHSLFPQPIGLYTLNRNLTPQELSFIKKQTICVNVGNSVSIDNKILQNKELTNLRDFIETSLSDYFIQVYDPKNKVSLKITQSWANYTETGQWHHKHSHSNSFVSGVFYPQAERNTDRIYFYKQGFQQIQFPPKSWNVWNSDSWWFEVGTGDLILFPSSLEHMVREVQNAQTRISIAFNTFPIGHIGDNVDLTELQIGDDCGSLRIS